jgi:hypothetical protein
MEVAKLTDLKRIVYDLCGGNESRANSLVKIARQEGLFTTGGRGKSAPDMRPSDFATALILGAVLTPPTKVGGVVRDILTSNLLQVVTVRKGNVKVITPDMEAADLLLAQFEIIAGRSLKLESVPRSLVGLLIEIFKRASNGAFWFHPEDRLRILESDAKIISVLELRPLEESVAGERAGAENGNYFVEAIRFSFACDIREIRASHFGIMERTVFGDALIEMADLAKGIESGKRADLSTSDERIIGKLGVLRWD